MREGQPLAQTFSIQAESEDLAGGRFLTSVDLYFAAKHDTLPVGVEIRNTVNGYPGIKVLPFSRQVKQSAEVNIDSSSATTANPLPASPARAASTAALSANRLV